MRRSPAVKCRRVLKPKELLCVWMCCVVGIYYRLGKNILDFMSMKSSGLPQNVVFTRGGNRSFAHRDQDANFCGKKNIGICNFSLSVIR